jgi:aminoglycoside phosphotransferase (APT) family kinase protein
MCTHDEIKARLQQIYREKVPSQTIEITNIEQITSGWETEIYSFTATGAGESRNLILRVYPGNDGPQKAVREFHSMDQLHTLGFPVPRVFLYEADTTSGKPFIIMEKISGHLMWSLIDKAPSKRETELFQVFCTLFYDLHTIDWKLFTGLSQYTPDPYAFITCYLKKGEKYIAAFKKHEFTPVLEWLKNRYTTVPCRRLSVTHGDYHPNNIIIHNGAPYVIDWSSVDVADSRIDIAWTLLLVSTYGKAEFRTTILSEYERAAGSPLECIEYFDVLACFKRLLSISVSLTDGPDKLGMRPGAEAMMKESAAHINKVYTLLCERTGITIKEVEELLSTL